MLAKQKKIDNTDCSKNEIKNMSDIEHFRY